MGHHRGVKGPDADRTVFDGGPFRDPDATVPAPRPAAAGDDSEQTTEPATRRAMPSAASHGSSPNLGAPAGTPPGRLAEIRDVLKDILKRHEKKIWWLHTAWALGLGASVATYAQKGFERARLLALSLAAAWILVVFFFRFFGTGAQQDFMTAWPGARRRFFVMSYLMKNLFQGMLFFQLPLYYKSTSIGAKTAVPLALLAGCAVLSTLDLVFDRFLLRFKLLASAFFAVTLFGSVNLVIPAILPDTPSVVTLLVSAGLSVATFLLFHLSLSSLRRPLAAGAFVSVVGFGVLGAYLLRRGVPPVPIFIQDGGVGTVLGPDGTLAVEVRAVREGTVKELYCVTDVKVVGAGDTFRHVWRKGRKVLEHTSAAAAPSQERHVVRVASMLPALPDDADGAYAVDVETASGQIVGRVTFSVKP
jgi:hypothetical protein